MSAQTDYNAGAEAERPAFDFARFSHRDSKALGRVQLRLQRLAAQVGDAGNMDDDTFDAKMAELDSLVLEAESVISLALVSVPRSWLVEGAPDALDWSDVASLEWVRADKFDDLRAALIEARSPESVTGK